MLRRNCYHLISINIRSYLSRHSAPNCPFCACNCQGTEPKIRVGLNEKGAPARGTVLILGIVAAPAAKPFSDGSPFNPILTYCCSLDAELFKLVSRWPKSSQFFTTA